MITSYSLGFIHSVGNGGLAESIEKAGVEQSTTETPAPADDAKTEEKADEAAGTEAKTDEPAVAEEAPAEENKTEAEEAK